jgi:hypothetical protein
MKTIGALAVLGLLCVSTAAQAASIITVYNKSSDSAVTTLPNGATATTTYQRSGGTVTATTTLQRSGAGNYQPTGAGGYKPMGGSSGSYNPMGSR